MTCFENIVRIRRLIYPNFFFAGRVVEMIVLPQSIVLLVEAMYQSAFLSLEFRLNSDLTSSRRGINLKNLSKIQVQLCFKFYTGNKQRK